MARETEHTLRGQGGLDIAGYSRCDFSSLVMKGVTEHCLRLRVRLSITSDDNCNLGWQ
jgi:hypothetical protein